MVRIEADMHRLAREAFARQPGLDHRKLAVAVAIAALDPRDDAAGGVALRLGRDDVVESQALRDRAGVDPIGSGRHHQPTPGFPVGGDAGARAGQDVAGDLPVGETLDDRLQPLRRNRVPDQQPVIDFLEPAAVDQLEQIGNHREQRERQQQQAPRREP